MNENDELITVKQAAQILNKRRFNIYEYIKRGSLKIKQRVNNKYPWYCKDCNECASKKSIIYKQNNIEKTRKCRNNWYQKNKHKPRIRLDIVFSKAIRKSLKEGKRGQHWENIVGYTIDELISHLESQFTKEMNWDNYGKYWHIHHLEPKNIFKYDSVNHLEFKLCWNLNNLSPKNSIDSVAEQDKLNNGRY